VTKSDASQDQGERGACAEGQRREKEAATSLPNRLVLAAVSSNCGASHQPAIISMLPVSASTRAAAKAAALWFGVYVFLAHAFVVWKWQTPASPPPMTTLGEDLSSAPTQQMQQQLQQLDAAVAQLQEAVRETQACTAALEEQLSQVGRLTRAVEEAGSTAAQKNKPAPTDPQQKDGLLKVRNLLKIPNLAQLRSGTQVSKTFALAVAELERLVAANEFEALAEYFGDFNATRTTTTTTSGGTTTTTTCNSLSELQEAQARVAQTFASQREVVDTGGLPLSFPETVARVRAALVAAVAEGVVVDGDDASATTTAASGSGGGAPSSSSSSSSSSGGADCLESPQDRILPWLEAGLEAIYRHQDLRGALLQALQRDGVDTTHIILDADLPRSSRQTAPQRGGTVNLRQVLDTPTLHQGSVVVDRLLDGISGHYDALDDLLDKWVYARVSGDDDDDRAVGRALVASLLRAAGKVEVPVPPSLLHQKAGALREEL